MKKEDDFGIDFRVISKVCRDAILVLFTEVEYSEGNKIRQSWLKLFFLFCHKI